MSQLVAVLGPRFQPWSAAEARLFLHAARGHRLGALYALGLMTGMRRGEVLGLAWVDVDFDRAVVRVWQALQRAGGGLRLGAGEDRRFNAVCGVASAVRAGVAGAPLAPGRATRCGGGSLG